MLERFGSIFMQNGDELFDLFGCHFVALCLSSVDSSSRDSAAARSFHAYSGTIITVSNKVLFLTAGHVLKHIDSAYAHPDVQVEKVVLADLHGIDRKTWRPIPFDIRKEPTWYIDQDGLDFGVIALRRHYQDLLAVNGILPISEDHWRFKPLDNLDLYIVMGIPTELTGKEPDRNGNLAVETVMLKIEKVEDPGIGTQQMISGRFFGKLVGEVPLQSLCGLSGGPIFGVSLNDPKRYWIVALQTVCISTRDTIVGCPMNMIGNIIEEEIKKLEKQQ